MRYEILERDKWNEFKDLTGDLLTPESEHAIAAVARTPEGEIVGIIFAQLVIHVEPMVLQSPKINFMRLYKLVKKELTGQPHFIFAPDQKIEGMCRLGGMSELPWKVFIQE